MRVNAATKRWIYNVTYQHVYKSVHMPYKINSRKISDAWMSG